MEEITQKYINKFKSFEVNFKNSSIIVSDYKGIIKLNMGEIKKELKKEKKGKFDKKMINLLHNIIVSLIQNKVPFKVIFEKDIHIKFSLDSYLTLTKNIVKLFGFSDKNEYPLSLIFDKIKNEYKIKFYKPLK